MAKKKVFLGYVEHGAGGPNYYVVASTEARAWRALNEYAAEMFDMSKQEVRDDGWVDYLYLDGDGLD